MVNAPTLAALAVTAGAAAAMDAVAGGGGLITLPALLVAGLDPVAALATNKLQSSFGAASATSVFFRRRLLGSPAAATFAAAAFVGALGGASCASRLPSTWLAAAAPVALLIVGAYFVLAPRPDIHAYRARLSPAAFAACGVSAIGFYDGIFGPGTGSFLTIGMVALLGFGLLEATAHAKLANTASNGGALVVFAMGGKVDWAVGLAMATGALIGGQIGSRLAIRHGATLIRPLIVTASLAMAVRLLADPANPLHRALAHAFGRLA